VGRAGSAAGHGCRPVQSFAQPFKCLPPVVEIKIEEPVKQPAAEVAATLSMLLISRSWWSPAMHGAVPEPAAEKAFGEVVIGAHMSARVRSPGILDMVRETIVTNAPNQIEHSERLPSERSISSAARPIDLGPKKAGERLFILSFRDISQVRRLDRMRSDFVANASHELRTPLASLRGFIETIQGPARTIRRRRKSFLGIMFDQTTRMSRLVDDLLSLSRLELKSHIAPDEKVNLVPLLGHVRDALAAACRGCRRRHHCICRKARPRCRRSRRTCPGLRKPDGKRLQIRPGGQKSRGLPEERARYARRGHRRRQGPGIPAEHVPRMTERFYRVNVEDSRSKKGTGLGLAIVKHILTRHRAG
jgi:two-component system phosphate regulon sensor histidine kinase PhoR